MTKAVKHQMVYMVHTENSVLSLSEIR